MIPKALLFLSEIMKLERAEESPTRPESYTRFPLWKKPPVQSQTSTEQNNSQSTEILMHFNWVLNYL